jgi:hypothetical protein
MSGEVVHEDEVRTRKSFNGYSALSGFAFFQSIDQKPSHGAHLLVPQINALQLQRPLIAQPVLHHCNRNPDAKRYRTGLPVANASNNRKTRQDAGWMDRWGCKSGPELAHQARFLLPELVPLLLLYLISADEPDVPVKAIRSS